MPNKKDTILITGGAGFIGSHLARSLSKKFRVVVFDNFTLRGNDKYQSPKGVKVVKGDIVRQKSIEQALRKYKPEIIVHLAAVHYIPFCDKHPKTAQKINVTGTANLINCFKKLGIAPFFVFASSISTYKNSSSVMDESTLQKPKTIYGQTKLEAENFIKLHWEDYAILRFSNVYGQGDLNPHIIPEIVKTLAKHRELKLGNLNTSRDFIHVSDLVKAIELIVRKRIAGVFNICSGKTTPIKEVLGIMERLLKTKFTIVTSQNKVRKNDNQTILLSNKKIKTFGWKPQYNLDKGLLQILKASGSSRKYFR